ncbi:hypothetical protein G3N59_20830 [Paraburkholderia sp. Ac-20340]|uniref:beta strand repeat-containing protein n=1 Tax=Paraburkholderia sp. Ac-20340 TaxID=2703888 RepID=UPI00197F78F1|nr:hypothetical protein [Paraburkholderia sp. Ac-20340]MBN3855827.1 hypothetical protein [Paraburkholderia sp. Ac-20340]
MSTSVYDVTQPNVALSIDNATFDVFNGASLSVTGSSNMVTLENGSQGASVNGNNNQISAAGINGVGVSETGTGNSETVGGEGASATEWGDGNTITIGANGFVSSNGTNAKIYATQGGDYINVAETGGMLYANNDEIHLWKGTTTLNGNGNTISATSVANWNPILDLNGSNNSVTMNTGGTFEVVTATGTVTDSNSGGVVLTGSVVPGSASLSGGVLTIQLGNGNVALVSGVSSGSQIEYIDAAGKATWTTLTDSNIKVVGDMYEVTAGVSATMSNASFDVFSGASLSVTGSSNMVMLENGSQGASVNGNNNQISAGGTNGARVSETGTGNSETVGGEGASATEWGDGNTITIGANGAVSSNGTNAKIYATQGGDYINVAETGARLYANNDEIHLWKGTTTLSGSGNTISATSVANWNPILNLNGSNNSVTMNTDGTFEVVTATGTVTDSNSGGVVLTGSVVPGSAALSSGVLTIQLGNGNVALVSGVSSGSQIEYIDAAGKATWTTLTDSNIKVVGDMYEVTAGVSATMSNASFDVFSGASLSVTGSSNMVMLENGSQGASVNGNNNQISAGGTNGARVSETGTGNSETVGGEGASATEWGDGNTITIGANGAVSSNGTNAKIYATQGGDYINVAETGARLYANNDEIHLWKGTTTLSGSGNTISATSVANWNPILNLNGSNNSVTMNTDGTFEVVTATGTVTDSNSGGVVLTGSVVPGSAALSSGVLTIQLGNGNVALVSGVSSGSQIEYDQDAGSLTWNVMDTGITPYQGTSAYTASGSVSVTMSNSTFNVLSGASLTLSGTSDIIDANNASVSLNGASSQVNGNSNSIKLGAGGNTLNLAGINNSISFDANAGAQTIQNASGVMLTESANGQIYWDQPASLSVKNGMATLGFANGNTVSISNVRSSVDGTSLQVTQLVSAMASYAGSDGAVTSSGATQVRTDMSPLLASSYH